MHRKLLLVSLVGLALALVAGCEKTEGNNDARVDGYTPTPDLGPPPAGFFLKKSGESVNVTAPTGSEYLLIVPYSVSETASTSIAFDVKIETGSATADGGIGSQSFPLRITRPRTSLSRTNPALWARWQERLAVEAWTRSLAETAAKSRHVSRKPPDLTSLHCACKLSSECGATEVCQAGACTATPTIKTEVMSATKTIQADVKKKGTVAAILVDPADTVTADLAPILEKFEKLIYPRDVGLFGNPALKSGAKASDRNKDGLVWLVVTSKVKEKKPAVGFFNAIDFTANANSNQADILYVEAGSVAKPADVYPILAHELQHMLNYAVKVYKPEADGGAAGPLEALWLDEGQAHFAEDASGFGTEQTLLLNQEVFPNFDTTSMLATTEAQDTLPMRGMAMTFVRYLFDAKKGATYNTDGTVTDKGGCAMLAKLHTSSKQGTAAVGEAFGDFKGAFDRWIAALSVDGRGIATYAAYGYGQVIEDPAQTGVKIGLKLRSAPLEAPPEDSISADQSGTIPNASAKFFKLTGKTGALKITVTSQDTDFRYGLFQVR